MVKIVKIDHNILAAEWLKKNNKQVYMEKTRVIIAPDDFEENGTIKLFLAGGITNCPDWQSEMIEKLSFIKNLTVFNPRRKNFPIHDPKASEEQITWEFNWLKNSDIISVFQK